jgi:hypothetical protein
MPGTIADVGRPCNKLLPDIDECVLLLSAEVLDPALGLSGAQSLLYQDIPGIIRALYFIKRSPNKLSAQSLYFGDELLLPPPPNLFQNDT